MGYNETAKHHRFVKKMNGVSFKDNPHLVYDDFNLYWMHRRYVYENKNICEVKSLRYNRFDGFYEIHHYDTEGNLIGFRNLSGHCVWYQEKPDYLDKE